MLETYEQNRQGRKRLRTISFWYFKWFFDVIWNYPGRFFKLHTLLSDPWEILRYIRIGAGGGQRRGSSQCCLKSSPPTPVRTTILHTSSLFDTFSSQHFSNYDYFSYLSHRSTVLNPTLQVSLVLTMVPIEIFPIIPTSLRITFIYSTHSPSQVHSFQLPIPTNAATPE